jgi:hypothetical protein
VPAETGLGWEGEIEIPGSAFTQLGWLMLTLTVASLPTACVEIVKPASGSEYVAPATRATSFQSK